ncbi:MAG: hypothetical protein WCD11_17760, partial [Solirubrobacteraceae bacterium]
MGTRVPELETGCRATAWADRATAPWLLFGLGGEGARVLALRAGGLGFTTWGLDGDVRGGGGSAESSG